MQVDSQSLSVSINEGLEQGLVVGDGLQDVPVRRHVSDRPLTEPSAAEPENVAEEQQRRVSARRRRRVLSVAAWAAPPHLPGLWMNLCRRALTSS